MRGLWVTVVLAGCVTSRGQSPGERSTMEWRVELPTAPSGSLRPNETGAKGDVRQVYRQVAPATVVVRSGGGYGSGVVIDARGFVLTNHHVVARAALVDLKPRVQVQRGVLRDGVMQLDPKSFDAWVVLDDPKRDLAVLRLIDPPSDLTAVKVARRDPTPGEPVAALGHGSIGLLWAIKDGEVASIGKLATHLASIVTADRAGAAELEARMPALVIQSSCSISPGDSGGPLVNLAGELVGLNAFLKADARAPVAASFHIHVSELRSLLEAVPDQPQPRLPDPWELVSRGQWFDVDGDGQNELFVSRQAMVVNGSQRAVGNGWSRALRPDAIVARLGDAWVEWLDQDGDGNFDRAIIGTRVGTAWKLERGAPVTFLGAASLVDPSSLTAERWPAIAKELGRLIAPVVGLPDPSLGDPIVKRDLDGNGTDDLWTSRRDAAVITWVATTEQLSPGDPAGMVRFVDEPGRRWVFISDELAVLSLEASVIERAWVRRDGSWSEAPQYKGADWRGLTVARHPTSKARLARSFSVLGVTMPMAPRVFPVLSSGQVTTRARSIVTVSDEASASVGFGLDAEIADAPDWAMNGFPGAGLLWSSSGDTESFQYDLDADGAIDAVIIRDQFGQRGHRLDQAGVMREDAALSNGPPVRPSLFADEARRSRLTTLAREAFAPELIEP